MMRLLISFVVVGFAIVGSVVVGSVHLASAQSLISPIAQVEQPTTIQISWMQSSARPRWGGGQ